MVINRLNEINVFNHPQPLLLKEGRKKCLTLMAVTHPRENEKIVDTRQPNGFYFTTTLSISLMPL